MLAVCLSENLKYPLSILKSVRLYIRCYVEELRFFFISHVCLQRAGVLTVLDKESLFARYVIIFHSMLFESVLHIVHL